MLSVLVWTHRGQDRRFQGNKRHFGGLRTISKPFDFHHVEFVLSLSSQTHLEQQHSC